MASGRPERKQNMSVDEQGRGAGQSNRKIISLGSPDCHIRLKLMRGDCQAWLSERWPYSASASLSRALDLHSDMLPLPCRLAHGCSIREVQNSIFSKSTSGGLPDDFSSKRSRGREMSVWAGLGLPERSFEVCRGSLQKMYSLFQRFSSEVLGYIFSESE